MRSIHLAKHSISLFLLLSGIMGFFTLPTAAQPVCSTPWFFEFREGYSESLCPQPVIFTTAVGQDFEGGRAYVYGPVMGDTRGTIYVIYNDGTWETHIDTWDGSNPGALDPAWIAPVGRFQPVDSLGKLWHENESVRSRLGWAYEAQQSFTGRMQIPNGLSQDFYVDHGKWGVVMRLTSVNMGPNTWQNAGRYNIDSSPLVCSAFFFTWRGGHSDAGCPLPVMYSYAVGQDFEGGRVYVYGPMPGETRGTVYIIYNDGTWETRVDTWDGSLADLTLIVPERRFAPMDSILRLWYYDDILRNRLGWAYEPQQEFTGRIQLISGVSQYFYIDHGKWGTVLRLTSVDMGPNTWRTVGRY